MSSFELKSAPRQIDDVFELISQSPLGDRILRQFLPLFRSGRIRIKAYPNELLSKLKAVLGPGQPIGAAFVTDGDTGVIHYDRTSPLGVLGPFIFHEIVHSLDVRLWDSARNGGSTARMRNERKKLMLLTETTAFNRQHELVTELKERVPGFAAFLAEQYPRVRILHERMTESEIDEMYDPAV